MSRRATLRLVGDCDNACIFCGQSGTAFDRVDDWRARLDASFAEGVDEVTFTGGEPTRFAALVDAVAYARRIGFVAVGIQTHAGLLDTVMVDALVGAGLTDAHLSVHGARPEVHDHHTGRAGAFVGVERALADLARHRVPVVVATVVTRSNARVLGELPTWLAGHSVAAWCVDMPRAAGQAARQFDRVMPRLALAIPFALHAIDRARKLGIPAAIRGAPSCLLGPWTSVRMNEPARDFAAVCESCPASAACSGVDPTYLARFSGDELRARAAFVPGEPMPAALARCFVGPGELVEHAVVVHDSAGAARHRLPVLQRPTPGRDEDRSRPRSAAALFSDLGEAPPSQSASPSPSPSPSSGGSSDPSGDA